MSDGNQRQEDATSPDLPRRAAAGDDSDYSLSVEEVAVLYEKAGLPRDRRTIQRYCAKGKLVCHSVEIPYGEKYLITPASVATHIAYIKEVRHAMVSHGEPRPAAVDVTVGKKAEEPRQDAATSTDGRRPAATAGEVSRPVAADTRVIGMLESENQFLRGQIAVKDGQIKEMTERARETNHLIAGLQRLLPMLTAGDRSRDFADETGPR
jgi:hypothetical protein